MMTVSQAGPAYVCRTPLNVKNMNDPTTVVFSSMPNGGSAGGTDAMIQAGNGPMEATQVLDIPYLFSAPRFSDNCMTISYESQQVAPGQGNVCMACYKRDKGVEMIRWSQYKNAWVVSFRRSKV
jgi:hypothetical protein